MLAPASILVIDGDEATRTFITEFLCDEGYSVHQAAEDYVLQIESTPDLILCDYRASNTTSLALARTVQDRAHAPIVLMTTDRQLPEVALLNASFCLVKPFNLDELLDCIESSIGQR